MKEPGHLHIHHCDRAVEKISRHPLNLASTRRRIKGFSYFQAFPSNTSYLLLFLQQYLQWSPFKEYDELHALGISLDLNNVKSLIEGAFPDQKQQKETQCSKLSGPLQENVQDLTSFLYDNKPCDSQSKYTFSCTTASKCTGKGLMKGEVVCVWEALLHSFFQKKLIKVRDVRWRRTLYDVLSLDLVEKAEGSLATSKKCSVLDDFFYDHSKDPEFFSKPDPIYSRFGKLRNGFHVSSNGLVFPNESEV